MQWNPVRPAGVTAVFEDYQVYLRRGDGSIVAHASGDTRRRHDGAGFLQWPVAPRRVKTTRASGTPKRGARAAFKKLPPSKCGCSRNANPSRSDGPRANADYYDIFRRTNGSALAWVGRSYSTSFADTTVPPGASVAYIVRARNSNTYTDSAQTAAIVRQVFRITALACTGAAGQNLALTFPGYPGATYRVQQSTTLAPGSWAETGITAPGTGSPQTLTVPAAVTPAHRGGGISAWWRSERGSPWPVALAR